MGGVGSQVVCCCCCCTGMSPWLRLGLSGGLGIGFGGPSECVGDSDFVGLRSFCSGEVGSLALCSGSRPGFGFGAGDALGLGFGGGDVSLGFVGGGGPGFFPRPTVGAGLTGRSRAEKRLDRFGREGLLVTWTEYRCSFGEERRDDTCALACGETGSRSWWLFSSLDTSMRRSARAEVSSERLRTLRGAAWLELGGGGRGFDVCDDMLCRKHTKVREGNPWF